MSRSTYLNSHLFRKISNQGFSLALVKLMVHLCRGTLHDRMLSLKLRLVKKRVEQDNIDVSSVQIRKTCCESNIWVCWLQGESEMPPVVRLCYDSMLRHSNGHNVVLLTKDNLREWVNLPEKYSLMFSRKQILPAQFADLIRINLLAQWGGLWLDATIFVLSDIPDWYFNVPFYSMKFAPDEIEISRRRWVPYCLGQGGDSNPVFPKLAQFFDKYTEIHDEFIDYFLIDYALDYLYDHDAQAHDAIASLPFNNENSSQLWLHLGEEYTPESFGGFTGDTVFYKFRYRSDEVSPEELCVGKNTVYQHLKDIVYGSDRQN